MKKIIVIIMVISALLIPIKSSNKTVETNMHLIQEKKAKIPEDIVLNPEDCLGYNLAMNFTFTQNIDKKKAIEKLKPYLLFKDGEPCKEDYGLVVNFNEADKQVFVSLTLPDGVNRNMSSTYHIIESKIAKYAAATPFKFIRYAIIVDSSSINETCDINQIPIEILNYHKDLEKNPEFDLKYSDSLYQNNDIWAESYFVHYNKNIRVAVNIRIVDDVKTAYLESLSERNTEIIPIADDIGKKEDEKDRLDEILDKMQENKAIKYSVTSVLGIAFVYVGFLILRKIWRSLKR